jgi:hypothetical protein
MAGRGAVPLPAGGDGPAQAGGGLLLGPGQVQDPVAQAGEQAGQGGGVEGLGVGGRVWAPFPGQLAAAVEQCRRPGQRAVLAGGHAAWARPVQAVARSR